MAFPTNPSVGQTFTAPSGAQFVYTSYGTWGPPATASSTYQIPLFQCRLVATNTTTLTLLPCNGNQIWINGLLWPIPSTGITLSNSGLLAAATSGSTSGAPLYYVYAFMAGSTMTLEASTTAYQKDATLNYPQKSGDATRTLVGMVALTGTAGQQGTFSDANMLRLTASYFNRQAKINRATGLGNVNTYATSVSEINSALRFSFVTWADEIVDVIAPSYNNDGVPGQQIFFGLLLDGAVYDPSYMTQVQSQYNGNYDYCMTTGLKANLTEGFHTITAYGYTTNGTYQNGFNASITATLRV